MTTINVKINQINERDGIMNVIHFNLQLPSKFNRYELSKGSIHYGYVLQWKVSFKMVPFSNPRHSDPGIFTLESPPPPPPLWGGKACSQN